MKRKSTVIILIFMILLLPAMVESKSYVREETVNMDEEPKEVDVEMNALTPHANVVITSNGDFSILGFAGGGTLSNPYRIENLNITVGAETGIYITGTNVYFVIRNNYIDARSTGVICINVGSDRATIEDNIMMNHRNRGISVLSSPYTVINNNTIYNADIEGISISNSPNSSLDNNLLYNCGFWISESTIEDYKSYTVGSNYVNDKPFGYLADAINTASSGALYGQRYCINYTHVGLYNWGAANASYGLVVVFSSQIVVNNCTFANNTNAGVVFYQSTESQVWESTFEDNDYGIWSIESTDLKVYENTFIDNKDGVYVEYTDDVQVYDCIFEYESGECWTGILVNSGTNVLIDNNTLNGGTSVGVEIAECTDVQLLNNNVTMYGNAGLYIYYSTNVNVTYNRVIDSDYGIQVENCTTSRIIYNLLENNTNEGVDLDQDTYSVLVYWNTFRNNNGNTSQASDDGNSNVWYNPVTLSGNWWSDYDFSGNYTITGLANNVDLYPLNVPPFPIPEFGVLGFLGVIFLLSLSIVILRNYRKRN